MATYHWVEMRCYRHILEIIWQDHISNNEVRRQVQREWTVMDTIRERELQLFSHICRMSDDRLLKSLVFGVVEGIKTTRTTCTEMDRRHSDVVRSRRSGSNDDDQEKRQLEEIRG